MPSNLKILLALCFVSFLAMKAIAQHDDTPEEILPFVMKEYSILGMENGDLNQDGIKDVV